MCIRDRNGCVCVCVFTVDAVACAVVGQPAAVRADTGGELRVGQSVAAIRRRTVAADGAYRPRSRTAAARRSVRHRPLLPSPAAARPATPAS